MNNNTIKIICRQIKKHQKKTYLIHHNIVNVNDIPYIENYIQYNNINLVMDKYRIDKYKIYIHFERYN
jgi:hypothetical protein